MVAGVFRDGHEAKVGLLHGDVFLEIAGEAAHDGRISMNLVARMKPGEKMSLKVLRENKQLTFKAEVGVRPIIASPEQ